MNSITLRIPATTANLGPGYDCLGVALRIYNRVTVRRGKPAAKPHPMAAKAASRFFETAEQKPFDFDWSITGDVPQSRGLGSSVTVRLGILHGLNELANCPLEREELFLLCSELEGHPDNAAPAEFGGFTVASMDGCLSFDVSPDLAFVLLIPDFEVSTPAARKVLPLDLQHESRRHSPPVNTRPCAGRSRIFSINPSASRSSRFCRTSSKRANRLGRWEAS